MQFAPALVFLLLASLGLAAKVGPSTPAPQTIPFLTPLVSEFSVDRIVRHFETEMEFLFGYKIRAVNSLLTLLQELSSFKASDIYSRFGGYNPETVQREMLQFLSLTRGSVEDSTPKLQEVLQSLFQAAAQKMELRSFPVDELLPASLIASTLEAYMVDRKFEFAKPQQKTDYLNGLVAFRDRFVAEHARRYEAFLTFRADPVGHVKDLLVPLALHYANVECPAAELCAHKVAQFTEFAVAAEGYALVQTVATKVIDNFRIGVKASAPVSKAILGALLETFLRARTNADFNLGKAVFLYYFSPSAFGQGASAAYQEFIRTKYRRERLKFSIADAKSGYPELLRLYTLDVLDTSLSVAEDFLRPDDLRFIFQNFHYFAADMDGHLVPYIQGVKRLFLANAAHLSDFYELFNGLYDAMLLSGPYLVGKFWPQDWSRPGLLFDDFLDRLLTWEKSMIWSWWEWQPSAEHFAVNIKTNYFFYKLVNLRVHLDQLAPNGVTFGLFENRDDFLIHQFTLLPEYRRLLFRIRGYKQKLKGFNYQVLAARSIASSALQDFIKYERDHAAARKRVEERVLVK